MTSREVIGEHTIDTSLLTGGWVLDAGARDFNFARGLAERGCKVLAIDADPTIESPKAVGIVFYNIAVDSRMGKRKLAMTEDPQARHLSNDGVEVMAMTVTGLLSLCTPGTKEFDVIKLDVEGSEWDVLGSLPGPIAKQISVEFHQHCAPRPEAEFDRLFSYLGQWYDVVQHEKTERYCAGPNYWDTLLVRR